MDRRGGWVWGGRGVGAEDFWEAGRGFNHARMPFLIQSNVCKLPEEHAVIHLYSVCKNHLGFLFGIFKSIWVIRVHHSLLEISCQLSGTVSSYRKVGFRQRFAICSLLGP